MPLHLRSAPVLSVRQHNPAPETSPVLSVQSYTNFLLELHFRKKDSILHRPRTNSPSHLQTVLIRTLLVKISFRIRLYWHRICYCSIHLLQHSQCILEHTTTSSELYIHHINIILAKLVHKGLFELIDALIHICFTFYAP